MCRTLLNLSLLGLLAAPLAAHATSLDEITFTGSGISYSYIVPDSPTSFTNPIGDATIQLTGVEVIQSSGATTFDTVDFLSAADGGGIYDPTGDSFSDSLSTSLFNDSLTNPEFNVGASGSGWTDNSGASFSYSIEAYTPADLPADPAPEPSSLVLLGTGALGLCGAFRRRLLA